MSVPAFIDLDESDQVVELRAYLKSKGATISERNAPEGPVQDLLQVIAATGVVWKESVADADVEGLFNSVISLLLLIPANQNEELVTALCDHVLNAQAPEKRNVIRLKILNTLFSGMPESCTHRYIAYITIVKLATNLDLIQAVNPDIDEIKGWFALWETPIVKVQALWRALYEGLAAGKPNEMAMKVMIELLSSYTTYNASQAREDALKCIVASIADPNILLMDHLLALKPVKFLEGEVIHDLLNIFVSGRLSQYVQFYNAHKEFVTSIGLNHEDNIQKMRVLTFMQMGENQQEVDFDTIQKEMNLEEEEVESFIINVLRTQAVRARIDQMAKKVIISCTTLRTFGKQQWQVLREQLSAWQQNLEIVLGNLQSIPAH